MTAAQNAINQTTYNTAELPASHYPDGITHFINCVAEGPAPGVTPNGAGTLTNPSTGFNNSNTWDIYVWFDPTASNFTQGNGSQIGGRNHRRTASSAFCGANGYTYPCGARNILQVNQTKYGTVPGFNNAEARAKLFVHEFTHLHSLNDCENGSPSATASGACGGRSLLDGAASTSGWRPGDRTDIFNMYSQTFTGTVCSGANFLWDNATSTYQGYGSAGQWNLTGTAWDQRADQIGISQNCFVTVCDFPFNTTASWGCVGYANVSNAFQWLVLPANQQNDVSSVEIHS